jgi:hypothetical protein
MMKDMAENMNLILSAQSLIMTELNLAMPAVRKMPVHAGTEILNIAEGEDKGNTNDDSKDNENINDSMPAHAGTGFFNFAEGEDKENTNGNSNEHEINNGTKNRKGQCPLPGQGCSPGMAQLPDIAGAGSVEAAASWEFFDDQALGVGQWIQFPEGSCNIIWHASGSLRPIPDNCVLITRVGDFGDRIPSGFLHPSQLEYTVTVQGSCPNATSEMPSSG